MTTTFVCRPRQQDNNAVIKRNNVLQKCPFGERAGSLTQFQTTVLNMTFTEKFRSGKIPTGDFNGEKITGGLWKWRKYKIEFYMRETPFNLAINWKILPRASAELSKDNGQRWCLIFKIAASFDFFICIIMNKLRSGLNIILSKTYTGCIELWNYLCFFFLN